MPILNITLTTKQVAHVQAAVDAFNAAHGTSATPQQWAKMVLKDAIIATLSNKASEDAVEALLEAQTADWIAP